MHTAIASSSHGTQVTLSHIVRHTEVMRYPSISFFGFARLSAFSTLAFSIGLCAVMLTPSGGTPTLQTISKWIKRVRAKLETVRCMLSHRVPMIGGVCHIKIKIAFVSFVSCIYELVCS